MKVAIIGNKKDNRKFRSKASKFGYQIFLYNKRFKRKNKQKKSGMTIFELLYELFYYFIISIRLLFSNVNVIHYNNTISFIMIWIIKIFSDKKIVVTLNDIEIHSFEHSKLYMFILRHGKTQALKYADEIIINDLNMQEQLINKYNKNVNYILTSLENLDDSSEIKMLLTIYKRTKTDKMEKAKLIEDDKRIKYINIFLYILYIITYSTVLVYLGMGKSISNWRYYILAIATIVSFISMIIVNGIKFYKKKIFGKELLFTIITAIMFLLISIFKAINAKVFLNYRTFVQISLFLLPSLYAFFVVNIFSIKTIFRLLEITTIIIICLYFQESGHQIFDFFKFENWKNINFFESHSFTESNNFAEMFLQLFLFFYYFKNLCYNPLEKRTLTIFSIITFIFTILSFKRLGVLFAIFIVILKHLKGIINYYNEIKINPALLLSITFTLLTMVYTLFVQGKIFTTIDVFKLTSGRNWIISLWANQNYLSYGYGTSMLIIGKYLEMDLIQIYLELNIFALFLFCFTFLRVAKRNIYSNIIMIYAFMNLLTSSSLPCTGGWVVMLISIACISSKKNENNIKIKE